MEFADNVIDIRDQYPLKREELSRIAESLGIRHPIDTITATSIPFSTDFLFTVNDGGKKIYLAWTVKPQGDLQNARVLENLEVE